MITHDEPGPARAARRSLALRLLTAVSCVLLTALAACSGSSGGSPAASASGSGAHPARGGVYRTAVSSFGLTNNMDPVGETQIGFAFSVYDAMLRELVNFRHVNGAAGTEILQEPTSQPWGVRDCAVRDPSGNLVRIAQA